MQHIVFTRFGIGVFDERWLSYRLYLFKALTLPSINKQICKNIKWYIFIDKDAPNFFKEEIYKIADESEYIYIVEVCFYFEYFDISKKITSSFIDKYGSVLISKIDDDDAININAILLIYNTVNRIENEVLTFPNGMEGLLQERVIKKCYRPFLTHNTFIYLNDSKFLDILKVGHHNIEEYCNKNNIKCRLIENDMPFFFYSRHKQSDSRFPAVKNKIINDPSSFTMNRVVYDSFGFDFEKFNAFRVKAIELPSSPNQKTWDINSDLNEKAYSFAKEMEKIKKNIINNGSDVFPEWCDE